MSNHTYEIRRYSPSSLSFYFGEAGYVGSLFVEERALHFEGDVDKSAQTFLAGVRKLLDQEAALTERARPGQEIEGEQEKRDREIRNKAIDDACNTINRLSADGELEGCASDFILSFASDLVQSLKEDAGRDDLKAGWRPIETAPTDGRSAIFWTPNGGCIIAPSHPIAEPTRQERLKMYESEGVWPNAGWTPTHWMPLPEPPKEG